MESCGNCANAYDEGYTAGRADLDLATARVARYRQALVTVMNVGDRAAVMVAQGALYDEVAALAPGEPKEGE